MMRAGTGARLAIAWVMLNMGALSACNDDPSATISGTPAKTAVVGRPYSFQPRVDGNAKGHLSFAISNKPSWASFDASDGRLSGTPASSEVGLFTGIRISVTGAARGELAPFSITVLPAPASPSASGPSASGGASAVTVYWQAPTDNSDGSALTDLSGYKIYYGGAPGNYSTTIQVPNPGITTYVVENLPSGQYYLAVTAYNSLGEESGFSSEVSTTVN